MLKFSYNQLADKNEQLTTLDEEISFGKDFYDRAKDLVLEVKNARVTGSLVYDKPFVLAQLHIVADVITPSTRSLTPVELHQDFKFLEGYTKEKPDQEDVEAIDTIIELESDVIDIQKAIEDNILLYIPMVVLTKEEKEEDKMPKGQDWEVISEDDYKKQTEEKPLNPELAKLKALFPEELNDDK